MSNIDLSNVTCVFRLYRVFVHVYVHHFDRIMSIGESKSNPYQWNFEIFWANEITASRELLKLLGAEPHVNTCYKHFYYFVTEFDLINEKVKALLLLRHSV